VRELRTRDINREELPKNSELKITREELPTAMWTKMKRIFYVPRRKFGNITASPTYVKFRNITASPTHVKFRNITASPTHVKFRNIAASPTHEIFPKWNIVSRFVDVTNRLGRSTLWVSAGKVGEPWNVTCVAPPIFPGKRVRSSCSLEFKIIIFVSQLVVPRHVNNCPNRIEIQIAVQKLFTWNGCNPE
jgi:hypothetical protein